MKLNRIHQIEEYIYQNETVTLDELCEKFNVSKNTIRRDINELSDKGVLKKVYGGVVANTTTLKNFESRTIKNQEEKRNISLFAGDFIEPNDIVFIDSGTTTKFMLTNLDPEISFTLLTNNLDIINAAAEFPNVQIILIGNTYKRATRSFINVAEEGTLINFNINKAFMATTGLAFRSGLSNSDRLEWEIKKQIVKRSQTVYLLADNSKFDTAALYTYASLDELDTVISNRPIPEEYQAYFIEHNIDLYLL